MYRFNEYNKQSYRLTPQKSYKNNDKPLLNEWNLALTGLIASILVILTKIISNNWEFLEKLVFEQRLITHTIITENHEVMFTLAWQKVARYSNIWLPAFCGLLVSYFTWIMVYLDSNVPGIQPPSPLSPKRYKEYSGHVFHLNYVFALLIGVMVFLYTYWKGISITY